MNKLAKGIVAGAVLAFAALRGGAYKDDPRPVWKVGCNYNPETRNLDKPVIVRA